MSLVVRGMTIYAHFIFVTDGKVYQSYNGTTWTNVHTAFGVPAWGNPTYNTSVRRKACPPTRNEEIYRGFRGALMRHAKLTYLTYDAYIQRQIAEDKQLLIEGSVVKIHASGASSSSSSKKSSSTTPAASSPVSEAPAAKKPKKKREKVELEGSSTAKGYMNNGVPKDRVLEFHEWFRSRTGKYKGVKLPEVVNIWKQETAKKKDEPVVEADPVAEAEPVIEAEPVPPQPRSLVEEREHKEDVPFYGRRRRDQAKFREDVMLNCGGRCVFTNAIAVRCEAAHLKAHARKGGASFKNGLLLRADIHKLFDAGLCAVDPRTMKIWFAPDLVKEDADLAAIDGAEMRQMMRPINKDNLEDRWDAFVKVLLA